MKYLVNGIVGVLTFIATYILGGWNVALQSLLIMIVLDYITGLLKAIYTKKLNSTIGLKGILKKFGYLIIVGLSYLVDRIVGDTSAIRNIVIYFFVANEGISVLENCGKMGVPLPDILKDTLEQIKGKD